MSALPTLLTLGNAVCGFGAITCAAGWPRYEPANCQLAAGLLLYLAMLFDGLDGAAARWVRQKSEFGARLDSMCDAISFGAAPAFLMIVLAQPLGYHPRVVWVVAALYVSCAVLRLARFNVEAADHEPGAFQGLPSPAAAAVVASFPIMLFGPQVLSGEETAEPGGFAWATQLLPVATLLVAGLMVSRVRYLHAFQQLTRRRRGRAHLVGLLFLVAVVAAAPRIAVPLLACGYAFVPPTRSVWVRLRRGSTGVPADQPGP